VAAVRLSLLGQDPEGYAKACSALAKSTNTYLDFSRIPADTLILTGTEDKISPPQLCKKYNDALQGRKGLKILQDVGHWHVLEDPEGVVGALSQIL
jgi:pimeloyl-ACP methyl ester carboxylesterase